MKQYFIWGLFSILTQLVTAQVGPNQNNEEERNSIIKFNLLSPVIGTITLSYEKSLNNDASFITTASYFTGQLFNTSVPVKGFSAALEYRFYIGETPIRGYYIQPFARYQYFKDIQTKEDELSVPGVGLLMGYQWVFLKRIAFDMNLGPSYNFSNLTSPGKNYSASDFKPFISGYWIRGGLSVGLLF
jgi:hypothetical protein